MRQAAVYQGLFLIAIGLFAFERNKAHPILIQKEMVKSERGVEVLSPELDEIYKRLQVAPIFVSAVDGLSLTQSARTVRIELKSDELYRAGELAIEETWFPILDQIGNAIFSRGEPKADVIFSSNTNLEKDAFSFSASRAEWLLRYFERKYQFRLDQERYQVLGLGKTTELDGKSIPTLWIVLKPVGEL